jgi:hypothetical protein
MALRFIGIDPSTGDGECPTVWLDEESGDLVLQGWRADAQTLAECVETGPVPMHEAVIRMPARMASIVKEACDASGRTDFR